MAAMAQVGTTAVSSGSTATPALTWDATPTDGQLLVIAIPLGSNVTISGLLAGWNLLEEASSTGARILWKIASGESASTGTLFTCSASNSWVCHGRRYSGPHASPLVFSQGFAPAGGATFNVTTTTGASDGVGQAVDDGVVVGVFALNGGYSAPVNDADWADLQSSSSLGRGQSAHIVDPPATTVQWSPSWTSSRAIRVLIAAFKPAGSGSQTADAGPAALTLAGVTPTVTTNLTVTPTPAALTLAGVTPTALDPDALQYPYAWAQIEPGVDGRASGSEFLSNTSAVFANADDDLKIAGVWPDGGRLLVIANALWSGSAGLVAGSANLRTAAGDIADTQRRVITGANRLRTDYRVMVTGTPGDPFEIWLGVAGDGTNAAGIRIADDNHALLYAVDPDYDRVPHFLGYLERPVQDGGISGGGSVDEAFPASSTWQRLLLESGVYADFPDDLVVPASGMILWGSWVTFVTATPSTADAYVGVWDRTAGAYLAGSGMIEAGGFGSGRNHAQLRKILRGLTPGAASWSIAYKAEGGTNDQVMKMDQDQKEGPLVIDLEEVTG